MRSTKYIINPKGLSEKIIIEFINTEMTLAEKRNYVNNYKIAVENSLINHEIKDKKESYK